MSKKTSVHFVGVVSQDEQYKWKIVTDRAKWVTVTMTWWVLRLQMEERPPIWWAAASILNKQSQKADEGQSSNLGVGRGATNWPCYEKDRCFLVWTGPLVRPKQCERSWSVGAWTGLIWLRIGLW
jgi:hypothetical protein